MNNTQLMEAEHDMHLEAIWEPDTPADVRMEALKRAVQLRAPLKAATDAAIAFEVEIDVTYRLP